MVIFTTTGQESLKPPVAPARPWASIGKRTRTNSAKLPTASLLRHAFLLLPLLPLPNELQVARSLPQHLLRLGEQTGREFLLHLIRRRPDFGLLRLLANLVRLSARVRRLGLACRRRVIGLFDGGALGHGCVGSFQRTSLLIWVGKTEEDKKLRRERFADQKITSGKKRLIVGGNIRGPLHNLSCRWELFKGTYPQAQSVPVNSFNQFFFSLPSSGDKRSSISDVNE